ncbi:hypothetical protein Ciccas_012321, partial [Cichlidogyrus casuarinus]
SRVTELEASQSGQDVAVIETSKPLLAQINMLERQKENIQTAAEDRRKTLETTISQTKRALEETSRELQQLQQESNAGESKLQKAQEDHRERELKLKEVIESMETEQRRLRIELESKVDEMKSMREECSELKSQEGLAQSEISELQSQLQSLELELQRRAELSASLSPASSHRPSRISTVAPAPAASLILQQGRLTTIEFLQASLAQKDGEMEQLSRDLAELMTQNEYLQQALIKQTNRADRLCKLSGRGQLDSSAKLEVISREPQSIGTSFGGYSGIFDEEETAPVHLQRVDDMDFGKGMSEGDTNYETLLDMYTKTLERNKELQLDIEDMKEAYKSQVGGLIVLFIHQD